VAEICPFRGIHYDQSVINDLSAVICPPFDTITPQLQEELYSRNQYNFVRLESAHDLPQDSDTDNRYTRSAATLERWLSEGILMVDPEPAIYLHDHYFWHRGREHRRRGMVVRVRLEEWEKMVVRPHEGTLAGPKDDRLKLLWTLQANTSPILAMYEDPGSEIASLLAAQERDSPLLTSGKTDGERHNLRAITDPDTVNQISSGLAGQPLYIADGHHRYSSALMYRRDRLLSLTSPSGDEPFNFVMMTLVAFNDPGLIILPPHRLVGGISGSVLDGLMERLEVFFEIEEWPLTISNVWRRIDDLLVEPGNVRLVFCGPAAEHLFVLRLRDTSAVSQIMPYFHSELYQRLDVSIVDHVILGKLLGLDISTGSGKVAYTYDRQDAVKKVASGEYQLAFLLRPITAELIKAVADVGDMMPGKATYFYPKAPSGLVFNRLV
jgi:uncharacterized protein (DUF1015 family)